MAIFLFGFAGKFGWCERVG